jgi:hypothetical protein
MPVNRARIAERVLPSSTKHGTVSTNPALRIATPVEPGGNIGRQFHAAKGAGSGSKGYQSEWAMSPWAPFGGWQ